MREELDVKDAQLHEVLSSSEDSDRRGRIISLAHFPSPVFDDFIHVFVRVDHCRAGRSQKLLSHTRNVVQDQDRRIQALEREILMMRQRARWGDDDDHGHGGAAAGGGTVYESTSGGEETTADSTG